MEDQEERMKNKKYRSLKMLSSDFILKFNPLVTRQIILSDLAEIHRVNSLYCPWSRSKVSIFFNEGLWRYKTRHILSVSASVKIDHPVNFV